MKCSAIILAAGASSRMGSPKALLDMRGEPVLQRLLRVYARHCAEVIVVVGDHGEQIRAAVPGWYVVNPSPERGQVSSLQCGLRALREDLPVMFQPVDYAAISGSTLSALLTAMERERPLIAIPRYAGKHGHPVMAGAALRSEFLALGDQATARDVIHAHRGETLYVDVNDPEILRDIDSPEDYRRMLDGLETVQ